MAPVPEAKAAIALPIEKIQTLPQGLDFHYQEGRARATVHVSHDTVYFYAQCDSLQRLVEHYEEVIDHYDAQREVAVHEEKKRSEDWRWWVLIAVAAVLGAGWLRR